MPLIPGAHTSSPARPAHQARLPSAVLPLPAATFIGRATELDAVQKLLGAGRLVTLTGPGGCGKTRLALEVASRSTATFQGGVRFVSLAPLEDPSHVASTVARALGVRESVGRPARASVIAAIEQREVLLILDNFEHVVDAAELVVEWLTACPGLAILATSRERLRLQGEHVYPVPPLSLTDATQPSPADSEAIRLFVERARAVNPAFALTESTAEIIADVCRRLDGLPLAIELAAARSRTLPPDVILARLTHTASTSLLELLSDGAGYLPHRQQTLRRTIAWSYDLLDEPERALFRRLSIFVAGFTLEAVEVVAGDDGRGMTAPATSAPLDSFTGTFDLVSSLLERSLLRRIDDVYDEARFEMLVTIREFAREQLDLSGEGEPFRTRHARYFHDLAAEIAPHLHGPDQARWLDVLDAEHGNLRAAMAWTAEHDLDSALGLGGALWRFWQVRGHVPEGRAWLERVVASDAARPTTTPASARANALNAVAFLAFMAGDYGQAIEWHRETLALRRAHCDREGIAESLNNLGLTLRCIGDHDGADTLFEEALQQSRALGNRAREANILNNQARSAFYEGKYAAAQALHEQALAAGRAAGDAWAVAICLGDLGDVHRTQGNTDAAGQLYAESLSAWRALGDLRGVAQCFEGFAGLLAETRPEDAARLFGAGAALRERIAEPCSLARRAQIEQTLARVRAMLNPAQFAAAWADGRSLSPDDAVAVVLALGVSPDS